jgi:K+-transporting ATPase ATPase B chain
LSAIGIAGMDRLIRFNVLATSGRAVEAAGDVDTLLLDKTGTITLGNRQASEIILADGVSRREASVAAYYSSLADETPEGRSIVALAEQDVAVAGNGKPPKDSTFVPFSAYTRMSGLDVACAETAATAPRSSRRMSSASHAPAARRCCSRKTRKSLGRSTSKTCSSRT